MANVEALTMTIEQLREEVARLQKSKTANSGNSLMGDVTGITQGDGFVKITLKKGVSRPSSSGKSTLLGAGSAKMTDGTRVSCSWFKK